MLKFAFQLGMKLAYDEVDYLTPQQMLAAQRLSGIGGALTGAVGGSLLGKYLGSHAARIFADSGLFGGLDSEKIERGKLIGALLGGLAGGGLGGYAGAQVPKLLKKELPQKKRTATKGEIIGLLPHTYSATPDQMIEASEFDDFYPEY